VTRWERVWGGRDVKLHVILSVLLWVVGFPIASADDSPAVASRRPAGSRDSRSVYTPRTESAVTNGLNWLAAQQQSDGSFGTVANYRKNVGIAGLCGMSFLASGSTPGRGAYGAAIDRTINYVLSCAQPSGFISEELAADRYHGPMYGHGFATLFLAEAYGMTGREDVGNVLRKATRLIVDSQNDQGGWRYNPQPEVGDISVTVCQVMALRAARNCGIGVPKETIELSIDYIRRSQNNDGGFKYQLLRSAESKFPRSAAALVGLFNSGVHEGDVIDRGLEYMMQFRPAGVVLQDMQHYYYGHYYAVQAAWHAGGTYWDQWYPATRDAFLEQQNPDGSWSDHWIGREYATAMSLLVLQTPNNLLPIFER
jgi:Prenyltransferase and squalene oxidase repeat